MEQTNAAVLLESDTNELEIVEFRIDGLDSNGEVIPSYFGVNVAKVREIIRIPHVWKSLNSKPGVAGMIKVRDRVLPVIDLSYILNKKCDQLEADRVIILEFNRLTVGVMVHSVSRIYRISWNQVEPPSKTVHSNQVTGLVKMDDRIILVLDFERIIGEMCHEYALPDADEIDLSNSEGTLDRASKTIIVADDSPFIRNTICTALRTAGYKILEACDGEEAWGVIVNQLEKSKAEQLPLTECMNLIVTDVEMPKMDGLHLTSKIKKQPELLEVPVIIFSSMASEDNMRKWLSLGAHSILTKPDLPDLVRVIDSILFQN